MCNDTDMDTHGAFGGLSAVWIAVAQSGNRVCDETGFKSWNIH